MDGAQAVPVDTKRGSPPNNPDRCYEPERVQQQGARVGKSGESLQVSQGSALLGAFPLKDVSQLVLCGNVSVSAQCLHLLCERGITTR